jgi:hypothetical protein
MVPAAVLELVGRHAGRERRRVARSASPSVDLPTTRRDP